MRRRSDKRSWYLPVLVVLLAAGATLATIAYARARDARLERDFDAHVSLRLDAVAARIRRYFYDAEQLTRVIAAELGSQRDRDPETVAWALREIYSVRRDPEIYGLGAFYAPRAFDRRTLYNSIYVHGGRPLAGEAASPIVPGLTEVRVASNRDDDDYTGFAWYAEGVARRERVDVIGPYHQDGRDFITVMTAIERGGRVVGVAAVDTLFSSFQHMLRTRAGDIAWIEDARTGAYHVGTGPRPSPAGRRAASLVIAGTRARLVLSVDAAPLRERWNGVMWEAIVLIAAIWAAAGLAVLVIVQRRRAQADAQAMRVEQERLAGEVQLARRIEAELRRAGFTDSLTGLPNRAGFLEYVNERLRDGASAAVFLIDLDRFSQINETFGHAAGDELVREIGDRLLYGCADGAHVARLGGDEFAVIAPTAEAGLDVAARRLLTLIAQPLTLLSHAVYARASIGVAMLERGASSQDVLRDADIALHAAKQNGGARWAVFDRAMRASVEHDALLEAELRAAIERGEVIAHYQPIVSVKTKQVVSFEALARWDRPGRGVLTAAEFVPLAEARGLIHELDAAIIFDVFEHLDELFGAYPDATVALNVSAAELAVTGLIDRFEALLRAHDIAPERIRLELTETTMMTRGGNAHDVLARLRSIGSDVVLDDFGTGYSSLAYLQQLPVSGVKIDRSFVEPLGTDPRAFELIRSIVAIAESFGLWTTAEGVENATQLRELERLGVDYAQGFFFSEALDLESIARLRSTESLGDPAKGAQ